MAAALACVAALGLAAGPPPRERLSVVSVASSNFRAQHVPLSLCAQWPAFVVPPGVGEADAVRVPRADDGAGWVDPVTFDELWLPADLPPPSLYPSVTLVLKDGAPRYICPTLDAVVEAAGREWRNRGQASVPLARTWLPWNDVPLDDLRLSAYVQPPPAAHADAAQPAPVYEPLAVLLDVREAVGAAAAVLANAPASLGDGFCYLSARVPGAPSLPAAGVGPGARLRLFLSDLESFPTALE